MAPTTCSRDDFPLPLGPAMATIPFSATSRSIASRARIVSRPLRCSLLTPRSAMSAPSSLLIPNGLQRGETNDLSHTPKAARDGDGDADTKEHTNGGGTRARGQVETLEQRVLVLRRKKRGDPQAERAARDRAANDGKESNPEQCADRAEGERLGQEAQHDARVGRSHGLERPDLPGPLPDDEEHDEE